MSFQLPYACGHDHEVRSSTIAELLFQTTDKAALRQTAQASLARFSSIESKEGMFRMAKKVQEGGFAFLADEEETRVFKGRREIGSIVTMMEASGRYCFRLGCDNREEPRTYRGRVRAAQALLLIDELQKSAKKRKWTLDELIVNAWDAKPHTAPN